MEQKQEKSMEEIFAELDEIITALQKQDVTLDQSFSLYESGMKKLQQCKEKIDTVEKKLLVLNSQGEYEEL